MPKNFFYRPVLIHVNGIKDVVSESRYFAKIINFGELLSEKRQARIDVYSLFFLGGGYSVLQ